MSLEGFVDKFGMVVCAVAVVAGLAWVALHPIVAGVLQIALVAAALVWHRHSPARA